MSRLVLFVEGDGDVTAAPVLLNRLWLELPPELQVGFVDPKPFRVGAITHLTGRVAENWLRYLGAACERKNLGAVLLLLDSDVVESDGGCIRDAAQTLAEAAREAGGGTLFSVAVVFFRKEYESLLIASYPFLPRRREGVILPANVEDAPRDAKGWLKKNLEGGYREKDDQVILTRHVNFDHLRGQRLRSFRRLEHALTELATAMATGQHVVSPLPPESDATGS